MRNLANLFVIVALAVFGLLSSNIPQAFADCTGVGSGTVCPK